MTPEEQRAAEEEIIRFQEENPDYWGDQDENGVDLARLRENLNLTPAERLTRLGMALAVTHLLGINNGRNQRNHTAAYAGGESIP